MANYITHYTKKKQQLVRASAKLRKMVAVRASEERLILAAAEVCAAKIRVIRAAIAVLPPWDDPNTAYRLAKLQRELAQAESVTVEEILAEYR